MCVESHILRMKGWEGTRTTNQRKLFLDARAINLKLETWNRPSRGRLWFRMRDCEVAMSLCEYLYLTMAVIYPCTDMLQKIRCAFWYARHCNWDSSDTMTYLFPVTIVGAYASFKYISIVHPTTSTTYNSKVFSIFSPLIMQRGKHPDGFASNEKLQP